MHRHYISLMLVVLVVNVLDSVFGADVSIKAGSSAVSGLHFLTNDTVMVSCESGEIGCYSASATAIREMRHRKVNAETLLGSAVSRDRNSYLIGTNSGAILCWDSQTLELGRTLLHHDNWVNCLEFAPSGALLASGSRDCKVLLWNWPNGSVRIALNGHEHWIESLAFQSTRPSLASGDWDGMVRVWNYETGELNSAIRIAGPSLAVMALSFSVDGSMLFAGGQDNCITVVRTNDWSKAGVITGHTSTVRAIVPWPEGTKLIAASQDHTIRMFDYVTLKELQRIGSHDGAWIMRLALSPDHKLLASGDFNGVVRIWNLNGLPRNGN